MMNPEAPTKTGASLSAPRGRSLIDRDSAQVYSVNLQRIFVRPCPSPCIYSLHDKVNETLLQCQPKIRKKMSKRATYKQLTENITKLIGIFGYNEQELAAQLKISSKAIKDWKQEAKDKRLDLENDKNLQRLNENLTTLHSSLNPQALEDNSQPVIPLPSKNISDDLRIRRIRSIYWELNKSRKDFYRATNIGISTQTAWFFSENDSAPELKALTVYRLFYNIQNLSYHINPLGLFDKNQPLWKSGISTRFDWEIEHLPLQYDLYLDRIKEVIRYWNINTNKLCKITNIANNTAKRLIKLSEQHKTEENKANTKDKQITYEKCLLSLRCHLESKLTHENKQLNLEWFYFGTGEPYTYIEQRQDRAANEPYLDSGPETTQSIRYDSQYGSPKSPSLQTQEPTSKFGSLLQALQKLLKPLLEDKEYYHKIINHLMDRYYHQHTKEREDLAIKTLAEIHDIQRFCKEEEYNDKLIAQNIILVLEGFYGPLRDHNTRKNHPFDNNKEENSG